MEISLNAEDILISLRFFSNRQYTTVHCHSCCHISVKPKKPQIIILKIL